MKAIRYTCLTIGQFFFILAMTACKSESANTGDKPPLPRSYYVSNEGNDEHDGSIQHPWQTITKVNSIKLNAGDAVLLRGSDTFTGTLRVGSHTNANVDKPVVITSYGAGRATINSGNQAALIIDSSAWIQVRSIKLIGAGRKNGSVSNGLAVSNSSHLLIDSIEISGYQKSGLSLYYSSETSIQNVYAYDNGYAGISVSGRTFHKKDCNNISIAHCRTENNPGDPTRLNNHSGNGIIVSQCTNVKIAWCTATNNGWDMPRKGNGPVGIWAWDADSLTIEHCLSYRNKTSPGGEDGGGFDFDGGVTNSVLQYCLSWENEGSGIGLFQYNDAGPWGNNTVRWNISVNDGRVSAAKAGIYIWNASESDMLKNCFIHNNTIYNDAHAAIRYAKGSANEGFVFYNNILTGNKEIISGTDSSGKFLGNCWWSYTDKFNVDNNKNFAAWASNHQQEIQEGKIAGINVDPVFQNLDYQMLTDASKLSSLQAFRPGNPVLSDHGIDIRKQTGIEVTGKDFMNNTPPPGGIGAAF